MTGRAARRHAYAYAVVRVVPRVERGEFLNAGVILHCPEKEFLDAAIALDERRLAVLAPGSDPAPIHHRLALIPRICRGDSEAGPIARLPQNERFHWLVAPVSTVVQVSPVHTGLCLDPTETLADLLQDLVLTPQPE